MIVDMNTAQILDALNRSTDGLIQLSTASEGERNAVSRLLADGLVSVTGWYTLPDFGGTTLVRTISLPKKEKVTVSFENMVLGLCDTFGMKKGDDPIKWLGAQLSKKSDISKIRVEQLASVSQNLMYMQNSVRALVEKMDKI